MRGIRFTTPNKYDKFLYLIFKNVPFDQYAWHVDQTEIIYYDKIHNRVSEDFFNHKILSGSDFKEAILRDNYYVYLANIQAYPLNSSHDSILSYYDFLRSKCQILLLCADATYYDLYCKNQSLLNDIYMACKFVFKDTEYITAENDSRTILRL